MRTIVYIDGFNLYHCAVSRTAYKWLDLPAFGDGLAGPNHTVVRVKYFTAKLKDLPHSPGSQQRQFIYWRALGTLPRLDVHLGKFSNDSDLREPVRMVKEEIGLPVGVCNPAGGRKDQLVGSFTRPLREWMLRDSQLPTNLTAAAGAFHKPPTW